MSSFLKPFLRLTLCGFFAGTVGFPALAAVLDKSGGDPTEPAKYVPDKDTMLILIEDFIRNPALVEVAADHMTRLVAGELIEHKVAPIINPDKLSLLHSDHPAEFHKLQIPELGFKLGAHQVLYANVTAFSVDPALGTDALTAHAEARVRVVDCVTGAIRWPRDGTSAGYPVMVDVPLSIDPENTREAGVRENLAQALAGKIAKLFYDAATSQQDPVPKYPESDLN